MLSNANYTPGKLLDRVAEKVGAKNDAQLARTLGIDGPRMSKLRTASQAIGDGMLVRMNELAGFSIGDMREMMGLPRRKYIQG